MFPPAAVLIPITRPAASASGPPESPGLMSALVCSTPCRVSVRPELWSLATMVRPRLLITPGATVGEPPWPASLPMARTGVPTPTSEESPVLTAVSPAAPAHLEQGDVVGRVVAENAGRIAAARRHQRHRDAGRLVDDVVVGQHEAVRGVDDEAGALRRLLQVLQVGGHVDDARLDLLVDGLVVQGYPLVRRGVPGVPAAPGPDDMTCCVATVAPMPAAADMAATSRWISSRRARRFPRPRFEGLAGGMGSPVPAVVLVHPTALLPEIDPRQ